MVKTDKALMAEAGRIHKLRQELLDLAVSATEHFFRLGEIMKEVRDDELWRAGYESFAAFFSDPELDYKKSSVYHAIKLAELFPKWKKLTDVPVGKLILIAPHVDSTNKEALIKDARGMAHSDLRHELVVKKLIEKDPKLKTFPKTYPCSVCSKVKGVNFDSLCHCGWTKEQIEHIRKLIDRVNMGGDLKNRKMNNEKS